MLDIKLGNVYLPPFGLHQITVDLIWFGWS